MEPTNLKPTPPDDAEIETWLRANAAPPPLRDDGFSSRVLASLPRTATRKSSRRTLLCFAGALTGAAFSLIQGANLPEFSRSLAVVGEGLIRSFAPLADLSTALALVVTASSLLVAFRRELRPRLDTWLKAR